MPRRHRAAPFADAPRRNSCRPVTAIDEARHPLPSCGGSAGVSNTIGSSCPAVRRRPSVVTAAPQASSLRPEYGRLKGCRTFQATPPRLSATTHDRRTRNLHVRICRPPSLGTGWPLRSGDVDRCSDRPGLIESLEQLVRQIGFGHEPAVVGYLARNGTTSSGRQHQSNVGPTLGHPRRQCKAVHGPRHLDVSKKHPDIVAPALKNRPGFIGARCLDDGEPGIFQHVYGHEANEPFVLDDQDQGGGGLLRTGHGTRTITST